MRLFCQYYHVLDLTDMSSAPYVVCEPLNSLDTVQWIERKAKASVSKMFSKQEKKKWNTEREAGMTEWMNVCHRLKATRHTNRRGIGVREWSDGVTLPASPTRLPLPTSAASCTSLCLSVFTTPSLFLTHWNVINLKFTSPLVAWFTFHSVFCCLSV